MTDPQPALDPAELLARFRASYRNYWSLWTTAGSVPEGVALRTPSDQPLSEAELPEAIRKLVDEYRKEHPDERLALVKYMRIVNGSPDVVVEDESDLPADADLLTLSQTVTLNTQDRVHVITDLFVARRG